MKSVYTFYKERLIEISGKNRSLYLKNFNKKNGFDIGKILYECPEKANELLEILWSGKSAPFSLISKDTKQAILKANKFEEKFPSKEFENDKDKAKYDARKRDAGKKIFLNEVENLKFLKREIEEIEKETGRYELYLCYPFVYGSIKNYTFKAPLLMFPVNIDIVDENSVNLWIKYGEQVQLNKTLMLAYAESKHLNLGEMEMEFDNLKSKFADMNALLTYLKSFGINVEFEPRKNMFAFNHYKEPSETDTPEIKQICVLARQSLANSIYADYDALEKKHLTNDSISELLNTKSKRTKINKCNELFLINNVDYAQEQVIRKVNESGNMVIYGPPGTGKSQTIVNVIADAICKNKKVLVVSQKKAALEVVFNRLGMLNSRAMFLSDSEKERRNFYERCYASHSELMQRKENEFLIKSFEEVGKKLELEIDNLNTISTCLTEPTPFGISLQEMYYNSYKIGKKTIDYQIYKELINDKKMMKLNFNELSNALSLLEEKNKAELYYNFIENKQKNPYIDHLRDDLSLHIIAKAQTELNALCSSRRPLFDETRYKYARQVLTYYNEVKSKNNINPLVKLVAKYEYTKADGFLKTSRVVFPLYPFAKAKMVKNENAIRKDFDTTIKAIDEYVADYEFLKDILSPSGYVMALDGILNGNNAVLRLILNAIDDYVNLRDVNQNIKNLNVNQKLVLDFAYKISGTFTRYMEVLQKILPVRIYHEIIHYEDEKKAILSTMVDFENIRARIVKLKQEQTEIAKQIANQSFVNDYNKMMNGSVGSKDYMYQISKKQKFWPIRKTMEVYGDYLFKLFPCWLLSPENVSSLLPLKKNMFDVVLFDEASQVFIENTIPTIFRGKTVVVAGDAKQLRPTTAFMKRYMGANVEAEELDYSTQAALEVESLLDLAVSRFASTNITYHYRSKNEELIDFSNRAFYNSNLQIAPNISKNVRHKPIERILVDGKWNGGKNKAEAEKVVALIKSILKNRKNNETVGVITFNSEQEVLIEDLIEKQCFADIEFRNLYIKESSRIENGEDVSLFIKNLENVQGDERDIIIFSIGYAKNEFGKVNSLFGSLSNEGGENRLNVAITRGKQKIYVVTSIEPEELKVENSKYVGPKLLKSYLAYARAVSNGNQTEVKNILNSLNGTEVESKSNVLGVLPIENQIAEKLNKLGYKTELQLGNSASKISIAVYDKKKDKYLLGIETDQLVINSCVSTIERDVFRNEFLKSRGWKMFRVWSRDWWHNSSAVMNAILKILEKSI